MHQVTVHEAKTNLSRLLQESMHGEEVIIARGKTPMVRLVPLSSARPKRKIGGAPGFVRRISKDFDKPLPEFKDYL